MDRINLSSKNFKENIKEDIKSHKNVDSVNENVRHFVEEIGIGISDSLLENMPLMYREGTRLSSDENHMYEFRDIRHFADFALKNDAFFSFGEGGFSATNTFYIFYSCKSFAYHAAIRYRDDATNHQEAISREFETLNQLIANPPNQDFKVIYSYDGVPGHLISYKYDQNEQTLSGIKL